MPSINPTDSSSITGLDSVRKSAVSNGSWALDCAAEPFREMGKLYTSLSAESEPRVYSIRERLGLLGELASSTAAVARKVFYSGGCHFITPYLINRSDLIPPQLKLFVEATMVLAFPISIFLSLGKGFTKSNLEWQTKVIRTLGEFRNEVMKSSRKVSPLLFMNILQTTNIPWYLANLTGVMGAGFAIQTLFETALLSTSLYSGFRMMKQGLELSKKGEGSIKNSENINRVSGLILFFIGLYTGLGSIGYGKKLIEGLWIAKGMSLSQLDLLSKAQALSALSHPKTCNAVIVDGFDFKRLIPDATSLGGYEVYKHCKTLAVNPQTENELVDFLNFAEKIFGGKIENLVMMGHGNSLGISIGKDMFLTAFNISRKVLGTMENTVADGGHILALGCKTASSDTLSFAQLLANRLRGKHVFGSKSTFTSNSVVLSEKSGKLFPTIYDDLHLLEVATTKDIKHNYAAHFIIPKTTNLPTSITEQTAHTTLLALMSLAVCCNRLFSIFVNRLRG